MTPDSPNRTGWPRALGLYALVAGAVSFWRLGAVGVLRMEGMLVDAARRMLAEGDWLVPRVYGEIYTYKPPLAYWLSSLPLRLDSQPDEWLLRLPFAACGFLLGLGILLLVGRQTSPRVGLLAALACVTCSIFVQQARMAEFDIPLAAGAGLAITAAAVNLARERPHPGLWLLAYAALAWGFLAKGVPALMVFGPGLLIAAVLTRRGRRLIAPGHLAAALAFLVLAGGYLTMAYRAAGPRVFSQPLQEAKIRGLSWGTGASDSALAQADYLDLTEEPSDAVARPYGSLARTLAKPILVAVALLPWSLLWPLAFSRRTRTAPPTTAGRLSLAARGFLIGGILAFMATPTHAMRYYLPLAAPAGIVCGVASVELHQLGARLVRWSRLAATLLALAVSSATAALAFVLPEPPMTLATRAALAAAGVLGVVITLRLRDRSATTALPALLVLTGLALLAAEGLGLQPARAQKRVLESQGRELARRLGTDRPLWILGPADLAGKSSSLYYYFGGEVRAFHRRGALPPDGAACVLPSDRLDDVHWPPEVRFHETGRIPGPRRDVVVGRCERADAAATDTGRS